MSFVIPNKHGHERASNPADLQSHTNWQIIKCRSLTFWSCWDLISRHFINCLHGGIWQLDIGAHWQLANEYNRVLKTVWSSYQPDLAILILFTFYGWILCILFIPTSRKFRLWCFTILFRNIVLKNSRKNGLAVIHSFQIFWILELETCVILYFLAARLTGWGLNLDSYRNCWQGDPGNCQQRGTDNCRW